MLDLRGMNADQATAAVAAQLGGDVQAAGEKRNKRRVSTTRDAVSLLIGAAIHAGGVTRTVYAWHPVEGGPTETPECTDDFADGSVSADWTVHYGTFNESGGLMAVTSLSAKEPGALATCSHLDGITDGYVKATIGMAFLGSLECGVIAGMVDNATAVSGLGLIVDAGDANKLKIVQYVDSVRADKLSCEVAVAEGDVIQLNFLDGVATAYLNGALVGTVEGIELPGDKWGLCADAAGASWRDFEGGTLS